MVALFRMEKLRAGSISIDGKDIAHVDLKTLRTKVGIIPQDPVMFSETVRFNLDPFHEHSDEAVWNVLERTHMKEAISNLPNKLLDIVSEGGENFSLGQRQVQ